MTPQKIMLRRQMLEGGSRLREQEQERDCRCGRSSRVDVMCMNTLPSGETSGRSPRRSPFEAQMA